jgi:hypothetical protein
MGIEYCESPFGPTLKLPGMLPTEFAMAGDIDTIAVRNEKAKISFVVIP